MKLVSKQNFISRAFRVLDAKKKSPSDCSSNGSNSPSAHESVFHVEFEFELTGLVIICLDDRFGRSLGRLF